MSLPTPNTRKEQYLNAIATGNASGLPTPITREEEYLEAIAKSGGGSGDGDMKKSVYDSDLDVAGAGGIKAFVNDAVSGKVDKVEGKGLSTNDYTDEDKAIVGGVTGALAEKADTEDIPDLVSDNLAKGILGNETVLSTDNVPFISKIMGTGKYQRKKFVGCSYVWNQLVDSNTESVTIASGHKYALYQNGAWSIGASDGTAIAVTGGSDLFTDLTQLFGSTAIVDAIYNLEQATAGAGIAKLKELGFFTEDYYAYDAGSIQSVDIKEYAVTGKNLFNKSTAFVGYKLLDNGNIQANQSFTASDYISVIPDSQLYLSNVSGNRVAITCAEYDSQKRFIKYASVSGSVKASGKITVSSDTYYIRVNMNIANSDICQVELGSTATAYEPYHKTTYPLTPTELRGVAKIDANNNIYCDGDEYASDGGHKSNCNIVDLGTLTWEKDTAEVDYATTVSLRNIIPNTMHNKIATMICSKYIATPFNDYTEVNKAIAVNSVGRVYIHDSDFVGKTAEEVKTYLSGTYLVYWKITPTTETLTPFDYPQSVGSIEEIVDYKVEQEQRDVAIPTGHVTEYMGKGGEFTLPTLPETPSVLAYDGHNFFWKPETA